jgi:photosystem II stability/assembly factor-like uncharacterized protein
MNKKISFLITFVVVAVFASGCTINLGGGGATGADGGVWKSIDSGLTWEQIIDVPAVDGKVASIAGVNIRRMTFDPQDYQTIYLSTEKSGVVYTNDGGIAWNQIEDFSGKKVRSVAVDPNNKCSLYVLSTNKMYKSTDCGRFWNNVYFHQNAEVVLTDIVVDSYNSSIMYISTSAGEILKSTNSGISWATVYRATSGMFVDLEISSSDSRVIYAATQKKGIFKTTNSGADWAGLGDGLKSYSGSHEYQGMVIDSDSSDSLILASKFGMLRTQDGGSTWEIVDLLPGEKKTSIYSLAVNPKDGDDIYYATRTTLVKTTDGGETWSSQQLPSSKVANRMIISPEDPRVIYMGIFKAD